MSDITVTGTPDYEKSVTELLAAIRKNPVGDIIVRGIEAINKDLTIVPYNAGKAAVLGDCNASTRPADARAAAHEGISGDLPGESGWYRGDPNNPYARMPYDGTNRTRATGTGSDVQIFFSPETSGKSGCGGGRYGSLPDEVLLHEMVHALRAMQGKRNPVPTEGGLKGYDNEEEFLAVVVTNVYMSANNKTQLRADHAGYTPLKAPLDTSAGFLADAGNWKLMSIYKLIWQPTFGLVGSVVTARFNPFREIYR